MRAIFSDVHGNLEALQAVLMEVARQPATSVYNLGDTMGCGPNPIECLDLAMGMEVVLLGIFDHGVLFDTDGFGPSAEQSVFWARTLLESSAEEPIVRERRFTFLAGLSPSHRQGHVLYVHGSPRNPLAEYVFPEDIYNKRKMSKIGTQFDRVCFTGNTGIPGVFVERRPGRWEFFGAEDFVGGFPVAGRRVLCNVGAVGWPRDGDWRACYVLFDGEAIWFRRVEYDVEATVRKVYAIPMLSNIYGNWLREGR